MNADDWRPDCPVCGEPMARRARGLREFWGCASYPQCTGTREMDYKGAGYEAQSRDSLPSERARRNDRRKWEQ